MAPLNNATGTYDDFFNDPKHSDFVLQIKVTKGKMDDVAYAISEDEVLEQILADQEKNVQILRVEPLHMSSPILAKRSTLFQKLFSKLQMDPKSPIIIRISASKVEAFMELLHFMYGRKLSSTTEKSRVALLDLATVADKYGVHSCLNQCIRLLSNLPMTKESASFYLEMASHVKATGNIRSLANAAKKFLIARYKDASEYKEEMCNLSFAAMQAIFDRDDIRVESEDALYDIIVKWAENRFPKLEQRRVIFRYNPSYITDITDIVRFPHMSYEKLREILPRHDFDPEFARNVINDALFFKAEPLNLRWTVTVGSKAILKFPYIKREYMKSTYDFHLSRDQCKKFKGVIIQTNYHDLKGITIESGRFYVGKEPYFLECGYYAPNVVSRRSSFGLFIKLENSSASEVTLNGAFLAMKKPEMEFVMVRSMKETTFTGGYGFPDLFEMFWESFIGDDSPYFIDNMLHLRVQLTPVQK